MKKNYLFYLAVTTSTLLSAQSFTDNFDTYNVNQKLGPQSPNWTVWSGTGAEGGSEDVTVVNSNSSSPSNSIFFSSTTVGGGPQDVILPFGGEHKTGTFEFGNDFFVQAGKGAYYNFQGTTVPGDIWSFNLFLNSDGTYTLGGDGGFLAGTYTQNTWFEFKVTANLNTGLWEAFIDGISQGTFQNIQTTVASVDFFPLQGDGFFVDDVFYNYTPFTLPTLNAAMFYIDPVGNVAGQTVTPKLVVRNVGSTAITSFSVSIDYNGGTMTKNITGVNIPSFGTYELTMNNTLMLISGANPMTATVSNVNGTTDGNAADDSKTIVINPVVPASGKKVLVEEGTGTWCQWCPRGAVYMDRLSLKYGEFYAGVAVHNGGNDPMVVPVYDNGMGGLISGYPSALVNRGIDMDPSEIEAPFIAELVIAPTGIMQNSASLSGNSLTVDVTTTFQQNGSGAYKVACVLTEDDVTGTTSGYAQANAYAGGSNGVMGGFELLPSTVPASQMVYNHVARAIEPSFEGAQGTLPSTFISGAQYTNSYTFTLSPSWSTADMHIVSMLIAPDGSVDNAGYISLADALLPVSILDLNQESTFVNVYPNPTNGNAFVHVRTSKSAEVSIDVKNSLGQVMSSKNYGFLDGKNDLPIQTNQLIPGVYFVDVNDGVTVQTKILVVQ